MTRCVEHIYDTLCVSLCLAALLHGQQRSLTCIEVETYAVWQVLLSCHVHPELQDAYHGCTTKLDPANHHACSRC